MPPLATSPSTDRTAGKFGHHPASCVALLCTAVLITILANAMDLDLLLADLYFDSQRQIFPWDTTWFAKDFMHGHVKMCYAGQGLWSLH